MTKRVRAFTLIELLVAIAIIALLISILVPSLSRARIKAKQSVTLAHLKGIGTSVTLYENDNKERLPTLIENEEKAFLGLGLLAKHYQMPPEYYINPNTNDTPSTIFTLDKRPVLADLEGVEINQKTAIGPNEIPRINWHCSYSYDNDVKRQGRSERLRVYLGDRADYERGRTYSANWNGEGMCLLWTDQHAEFFRQKSLKAQSDPNMYHHNEFDGEGADEESDGVVVTPNTIDTHLRFFTEEEDDELLPN